ncbi:MAG TPA: hypothetical protein VH107_11145 [Lacipirellulaceae bacterium]|jgi:hypothetical protein|nr:hypothetical protein [Lacipirellulaceae bacterium]
MGILQDIANVVGGDKLQQLANGEGNFDQQGSPDQSTIQQLLKKIDPQTLQKILGQVTQQVDPQEYSDHVTPGVGNTNPLGNLGAGGLATIATVLLNHLKQAGAQPTQIPGVETSDPTQMDANDVAKVAQYTQEKHPDAFGKAAAQIGQEKPDLLHSFVGKAGMALAAAALASHFIKMDRKAPK